MHFVGIAVQLPAVTMSEGGRVVPLNDKNGGTQQDMDDMKENDKDRIVKSKQRLQFRPAPIALTCMKHKKHLLADPSAEEESLLQSSITVATDSSERLISFFKPGGSVSVTSATLQVCLVVHLLVIYTPHVVVVEGLCWKALVI